MLCTSYIIGCWNLMPSSTCLCIFGSSSSTATASKSSSSLCCSATSSCFLDANRAEKKLETCWGVRKSEEGNNRSQLVFPADLIYGHILCGLGNYCGVNVSSCYLTDFKGVRQIFSLGIGKSQAFRARRFSASVLRNDTNMCAIAIARTLRGTSI